MPRRSRCERYGCTSSVDVAWAHDAGDYLCRTCRLDGDYTVWCGDCDGWVTDYHQREYHDDYDDDEYTEPEYCSLHDRDHGRCNSDDPYRIVRQLVQSYSYRPEPVFHGHGPLYLGPELEINTGSTMDTRAAAAQLATDAMGELGYLKEDGSIPHGFEIVTHPMSYRWASERFPWKMLDDLTALGCTVNSECGLHVHVSRAGFKSPAHVYRWMQLIYRNSRQMIRLGRRDPSQWGGFNQEHRRHFRYYAKGLAGDRYVAINPQNRATFELRWMGASLDTQTVRAAFGLADATVKYTAALDSPKILKGDGLKWNKFVEWVNSTKSDDYRPLIKEMEIRGCAS